MISDTEISLRIHGSADGPTVVYLPGMHGDWTMAGSFRARMQTEVRFVELSYPRTTSWSLKDYTDAIEMALIKHGVTHGWVVAESWSSQPTWQLTERSRLGGGFRVDGVVLAGGFVRHPWPRAVTWVRRRGETIPFEALQRFLRIYPLYGRLRYRHAPETLADVPEFLARRTEQDRRSTVYRLRLMEENDLRLLARAFTGPVHYLTGAADPIVPWPWVRRWLKANCPGYRGTRVFWTSDHNVLNSRGAAEQVLEWVGDC